MKLALMQPYFFPYLGYFDLINRADRWIVFDTAQYIKQGWVNRNRVLHANEGWQYIIAPVCKFKHTATIDDVVVDEMSGWRARVLRQLFHYRKSAPFYRDVIRLVECCLGEPEYRISRLNVSILEKVCGYLGLEFRYNFLSDLGLDFGRNNGPGDWGLKTSVALGATEYFNASGGAALFDAAAFQSAGVKLTVLDFHTFEYVVNGYTFEPNLSVIDAMMWNSPGVIKAYLEARAAA